MAREGAPRDHRVVARSDRCVCGQSSALLRRRVPSRLREPLRVTLGEEWHGGGLPRTSLVAFARSEYVDASFLGLAGCSPAYLVGRDPRAPAPAADVVDRGCPWCLS